jgi:pimeloyl-ACP methyl ester carboxylesterase
VCLVQGADDPVVPAQGNLRSRERVDAPFEAHVVPGTGHFPHEEDPEAFAAVLLPWLDGLRLA